MGYSIIFETKIINLKDGRLLHLDLSGCNNDDSGRNRGDFTGKIYTKEDFINYAESFMIDGKPQTDGFELKIGSKYAHYYDYGSHLLRMMKRAETWEELDCVGRYVKVNKIDGIEIIEPEHKIISLKEFENLPLQAMSYRRLITALDTEDDIIKALDNKETVIFYIGKLTKRKTA